MPSIYRLGAMMLLRVLDPIHQVTVDTDICRIKVQNRTVLKQMYHPHSVDHGAIVNQKQTMTLTFWGQYVNFRRALVDGRHVIPNAKSGKNPGVERNI